MRSKKKAPRGKNSRSRKLARYRDNLGALCVMRRHLQEAEERLLGLIAGKPAGPATDVDDDCPDLSDPNAPPDVYFCQLIARIEYLLGLIDCDEYKKRVKECTPIQ